MCCIVWYCDAFIIFWALFACLPTFGHHAPTVLYGRISTTCPKRTPLGPHCLSLNINGFHVRCLILDASLLCQIWLLSHKSANRCKVWFGASLFGKLIQRATSNLIDPTAVLVYYYQLPNTLNYTSTLCLCYYSTTATYTRLLLLHDYYYSALLLLYGISATVLPQHLPTTLWLIHIATTYYYYNITTILLIHYYYIDSTLIVHHYYITMVYLRRHG